MATTFKNEVVKGSIFGTAEGALFGAGENLYHHIKQDLGFEKKPGSILEENWKKTGGKLEVA